MYINGVDFPNEMIDAIIEDKLVVFVGAGASKGEPTCLPDFEELVKEVAKGTGETCKEECLVEQLLLLVAEPHLE